MAKLVKLIRADLVTSENKLPSVIDASITEITAEDLLGTTAIKAYAFYNCVNLRSIVCPNSIKTIGRDAFDYCRALTSITLPQDLATIENYLFLYTNIVDLTIPSSVSKIGNQIINTDVFKNLTILATTPPTIEYNSFGYSSDSKIETIKVPKGSGDAYKTATNWSSFADIITELQV